MRRVDEDGIEIREPLIDDTNPLIVDKQTPIVDTKPPIDQQINSTTIENPDTNLCRVSKLINLSSIVQLGSSN
jgi:hypothetical protein